MKKEYAKHDEEFKKMIVNLCQYSFQILLKFLQELQFSNNNPLSIVLVLFYHNYPSFKNY